MPDPLSGRRLRRHGLLGKTLTLKIRSGDFTTITRSKTLDVATDETQVIWDAAADLFTEWPRRKPPAVRLIGVGISQFSMGPGQQLSLFGRQESERRRQLDQAMDEIRDRFGDGVIGRGGERGQ